MKIQEVVVELKAQANPKNVAGMARYGISVKGALGVSMPYLRALGKRIGRDHPLALALWKSGIHEARILAALVDDPRQVTESQLEKWVRELESWDVCDQLCSNLIDRTPFAVAKAFEWTQREEEFVKRAGFVVMAALSVHDKQSPDKLFIQFLSVIERESTDGRNFVKKAVNWALRQIGKRNMVLHAAAVQCAERIEQIDHRAARWIAKDALRELANRKIVERIIIKNRKRGLA
ncbi:MAG: DNA alkylation repair protein [Lentisphaerota bacterium]